MDTVVISYNDRSKGAKRLAEELNVPLHSKNMELPKWAKRVVNWGNGNLEVPSGVQVLNNTTSICRCVNKMLTFKALEEAKVPCVPFTFVQSEAQKWLDNGSKVCCRMSVEGCDGEGLVLVAPGDGPLPYARLYTKFTPSSSEYRCNSTRLELASAHIKVMCSGWEQNGRKYNHDVKTTSGGYGFNYIDSYDVPAMLHDVSVRAIKALGLDYGGVDIIKDKASGNFLVLEVNSAPALTPIAGVKMAHAIKKLF